MSLSTPPYSLQPFPTPSGSFRHPTHTATTPAANQGGDRSGDGINRNSLGIILTFVGAFFALIAFGFGSRYIRRRNRAASNALSEGQSRRARTRKPKMWEVWLDDHGRDEGRVEGRLETWQPVAAWATGESQRRVQKLGRRATPPLPRPPIPRPMEQHVMMSQAWFRGVYGMDEPETPSPPEPPEPLPVRVAVLIAMPSQARARQGTPSAPSGDEKPDAEQRESAGDVDDARAFGHDGEYVLGITDLRMQLGSDMQDGTHPSSPSWP